MIFNPKYKHSKLKKEDGDSLRPPNLCFKLEFILSAS